MITTLPEAWLATDCSEQDVALYMEDDAWMLQEKFDGIRVRFLNDGGVARGFNRSGLSRPLSPTFSDLIRRLPHDTCLDGEYLPYSVNFVAFDATLLEGRPLTTEPAETRLSIAETLVSQLQAPMLMRPVLSAFTQKDKRALVAGIQVRTGEGLIFKHRLAPYTPGRPALGGLCRRFKYTKRAEVICYRHPEETRKSWMMYVLNRIANPDPALQRPAGLAPQSVGTISSHRHHDTLKPGQAAIWEVEYLYAGPTLNLVQPRLVRPRPDKPMEECTTDQLVIGGRFRTAA